MQHLKTFQLDIWPAEKFVITLSLVALAINLIQIVWQDVMIDWAGYALVLAVALVTFAGGQFYRQTNRSARIGAALTSTSIIIFFTMVISVFNYLLLPTVRPSIDPFLIELDAMLGFHWPDIILYAADHPWVSEILRYAYVSTMPQLALLFIVLGLSGRVRDLHVLLVGIAITATCAVVFWGFFPSHGANSLFALPAALEEAVDPVLRSDYGLELIRLAEQGPGYITPAEIKGLIAFPSYHAVLALLAIYCVRNVRWLYPIFFVVNMLVLPGAVMHGGHHLIDIPAGLIWFLVGLMLTEKVVGHHYQAGRNPNVLEPEFSR